MSTSLFLYVMKHSIHRAPAGLSAVTGLCSPDEWLHAFLGRTEFAEVPLSVDQGHVIGADLLPETWSTRNASAVGQDARGEDPAARRKRFSEEQIIGVLKEAEAGGKSADLCRRHGISEQTFYRLKAKYAGLEVNEARRLRTLEHDEHSTRRSKSL